MNQRTNSPTRPSVPTPVKQLPIDAAVREASLLSGFGKYEAFTPLPTRLKETGQQQDKHKEFWGRAQTAGLLPPDKRKASAERGLPGFLLSLDSGAAPP